MLLSEWYLGPKTPIIWVLGALGKAKRVAAAQTVHRLPKTIRHKSYQYLGFRGSFEGFTGVDRGIYGDIGFRVTKGPLRVDIGVPLVA